MNEKRFKDCVSLLISIIQNYNNHVRFKMSGSPCEIYGQFFKLKSLMENECCAFVTETTPLFGNFVFTKLKFDFSYLKFCEVLKDIGFCVEGGYLVYRFKISASVNDKLSVGTVGVGRNPGIEGSMSNVCGAGSDAQSIFNLGVIVVAIEEDISC